MASSPRERQRLHITASRLLSDCTSLGLLQKSNKACSVHSAQEATVSATVDGGVPCLSGKMVALSNSLAPGTEPANADGRKRKPKRPRPLLEQVQEDPQAAGDSKFARALGSVDAQTRNQGLTALAAWLSRRATVSEPEMSKIWKGLFYCFWHSDKQPVQVSLAALADFKHTGSAHVHTDTGAMSSRCMVVVAEHLLQFS